MATPRTSQFNMGLSSAEAMAACGPAAAIAFAQTYGRNPTVGEAMQLARSVGWGPSGGMAGPASEQQLLNRMGINTHLTPGANWNSIAQEAQTGNPVIISTPGHYFYADGYNAANNTYHVGTSGTDLRSGSEWMSPDQMQALMGTVQATLYADHPLEGASTLTYNPQANGTPQQAYSNWMRGEQNQNFSQAPSNAAFLNWAYGTKIPTQRGDQMQAYVNQAQVAPQDTSSLSAQYNGKPYVAEAILAAQTAGIDPAIFLKQINRESGFNPNAGSKAGAQGIAQIVPKYHPGVNTSDPVASLNYAANLDKQLLSQYGGDYTKALVAYNGGQGAVDAWNNGQAYGESQAYINDILGGQTPQPTGQSPGATQYNQPQQPKPPSLLSQLLKSGGEYTSSPNKLSGMLSNPATISQLYNPNPYPSMQPPTANPNPFSMFTRLG